MDIGFFGDRYLIGSQLGLDALTENCRARDLQTDRIVMVRVLREEFSTDAKFVMRFQLAAKVQSAFQHPNIVQFYDYGQIGGKYFIATELVEGTNLLHYMRARRTVEVPMSIRIAHDVALALEAAHRRNIVHRAVGPRNILLARDGSIKLTDFGMARLVGINISVDLGMTYVPEQAQGEMVGPTADVYALGIVLYQMLTGRVPFDGDTPVAVSMAHIQEQPTPPRELNPDISTDLDALVLRCLEKDPMMRYQNGSEVARALEGLC